MVRTEPARQARAQPALATVAAGAILGAGLIHLAIVPLHWAHAPAHGLFFALAGAAEVIWAAVFWGRKSATRSQVGIVLAGGLFTLWAMTRLLPAPFDHAGDDVGVVDIASEILEGIGLFALVAQALSVTGAAGMRGSAWRRAGRAVTLALVIAGLGYGLAGAAESVFAWLGERDPGRQTEPSSGGQREGLPDTLELVVAGIGTPFVNGSEVPVAGDVVAGLTIGPGDGRYRRSIDVYLHRVEPSFAPLEDATVQVAGHMRYMDHGSFRQRALPLGGGHYVLPLQFAMPGEWQLEFEISGASVHSVLQLDLDLSE